MTQDLGNGAMFMQGMGLMSQAAMGKMQSLGQNFSNLMGTMGQDMAKARQQRRGPTGPSPIDIPPEISGSGSGGGNQGGGQGGGGKGPGAPKPGPDMNGNRGTAGINFSRGGMFRGAAALTGVGLGAQAMMEGEVGKGAGIMAGVTAGAQVGSRMGGTPMGKLIGGVVGGVTGGVGGAMGGSYIDRTMAGVTGQDPSGKYPQEAQRYQTGQNLNTFTQAMNAIQKTALENDLLRMKAQEPVINRMLDKQLVRQQAMNASLTNSYAMLGTLSTAGKLAQQGQMEAGANFRAAIQSNPFGNSVVASPSISF